MKELVLRPHQSHVEGQLRDRLRAGVSWIVLVAPTAFGKTETAMFLIRLALQKGSRVWFMVDRITLVKQTSDRFNDYGIDHGVIQGDNGMNDRYAPEKNVQILSIQTFERRDLGYEPDLIFYDECHAQYAETLARLKRFKKTRVIGLTATPFTAGMAENWDGLVNGATVNRLLHEKYLTPLKIMACVAPDMAGVKKKPNGEFADEEAGQRGIVIVGDVVKTWVEQTQAFFGRPVKTIVFSPSVRHGEELCRQFAEAGFNFQQISYLDKSDKERDDKIEEFRKPDSAIDGLVSCAVLTKGFDVPDVLCGISCRPYRKSFSSHIQEMGRVMRTAPGKEFGLWLDHSGNCISFAEDTAWLYEYGVDSLSNAQKKDSEVREPSDVVRQKYYCGGCGMQMEAAAIACASCGWERPRRGEIQTVEGELIDFEMSTKAAFQPRKGLRAGCLANPRAIWNAALAYCLANGTRGEEASRKWAYGVWRGIYPNSKLPYGLYDAACQYGAVQTDEYGLIEREIRQFRKKSNSRRAA
ncbi:ATP-dependent helicase [Mesorhizobium sp. B2-2-4]|uniref:DEAD/DEAH box helicase n=1 Tax=unclassified Mesorhizobium TaxID=325217 RepID=UPI001129293C|nr:MULTISPECIES: DEAD/DEAH box helicase family protein [unclassified Mesorhizobium]TPM59135.1 ATP-dependent helicase [Mesorhizobium sp. B2-2-4]TPM67620.1 ATP-dependent helicase [Mesorhizobium sp. B2-2-1]TPN66902.1 ATP-dependent helicase [Mesorhizobium sp. B1-1-3]